MGGTLGWYAWMVEFLVQGCFPSIMSNNVSLSSAKTATCLLLQTFFCMSPSGSEVVFGHLESKVHVAGFNFLRGSVSSSK